MERFIEHFLRGIKGLTSTSYGGLGAHVTTCPTWTELSEGGITTLCPGMAAHTAWGRSGDYAFLRASGRARDYAIVQLVNNYRQRHNGKLPRRLPRENMSNYVDKSANGMSVLGRSSKTAS